MEDDERRVAGGPGVRVGRGTRAGPNAEALAAQAVQGSLVELSSAETHRADAREPCWNMPSRPVSLIRTMSTRRSSHSGLDGLRTRVRDRQVRAHRWRSSCRCLSSSGVLMSLEVVAEAATLAEVAAQEGQAA